jgi:ankyrin repeat protein
VSFLDALQVAEVETMMNEISRTSGEAFRAKLKKVFTSLKYDEKIWEVERNLHTYISVLILHHVVDPAAAPPMPVEDTFFDVREQVADPFVECPNLMKELENELRSASRSQVKNPTIVTLMGPKGVGKTQLALSYCHSARSLGQFRTVFWLDASSLENVYLGFESIYATIRKSTDGTRKDKIEFVKSFLDDLWHPWLLVLDDYDPTALYNDIMEILPTRGYGGIVLITRSEEKRGLGKVIQVPRFLSREDQNHLNTLLKNAVQEKEVDKIIDLVNQGADVDSRIWDQWPCLHRCALFGLEDAVTFLLARGANPNPPVQILKPLYWAASGGHESVCQLLLDHEDQTGQTSKPADTQAAFDAAANEGKLGVMRLLYKRGAALNSKNQYGQTPLQTAAQKGYLEVVNFIINEGFLKENDTEGGQSFIAAASAGHLDIVKIISSEGKIDPNCQDAQGLTALCHAAGLKNKANEENGYEMVEFLLAKGADPNIIGSDGPLHKAAVYEHTRIMRLLLDNGADPTLDCHGWDPLSSAIKYKSPKAVTMLLEANVPDSESRSAWLNSNLRYASRAGDRETILQILKAGADINAVEDTGVPKGATPLLLAVLHGHVKAAQLLVRRGARQDIADEKGRFPLPTAAELGYDSIVRDLFRAGGDPNMKSGMNEDTLLLLAVGKEHEKVVKVLLDNGADRTLENKFGDMALDVAEEKGHKEMVKLLEG